jgi:hypothetical protein
VDWVRPELTGRLPTISKILSLTSIATLSPGQIRETDRSLFYGPNQGILKGEVSLYH